MATRKPLVLSDLLKVEELQAGDDIGSGLPTPDEAGQVLYAATAAAFTAEVPMLGPPGWLHSGGKLLVK